MALPARRTSELAALTDEISVIGAAVERISDEQIQQGKVLVRLDERSRGQAQTSLSIKRSQGLLTGLLVAVALMGGAQVFGQCGSGNTIQSERPQQVQMERGK